MKKIFLLVVVASVLFLGQVVLAENAMVSVSPTSGTNNVGVGFSVNVQVNPAGNKTCVVKGALVFSNLTCQGISVAGGLMATVTPTCSSPSFSIGIPTCTTDIKNILAVSVKGLSAGSASLGFSGATVIGAGVNVASVTQGGTYTINAVAVQPPVVIAPQPSPKVTAGKAKPVVVTPTTPEQTGTENTIPKEVGLASASSTMKDLAKSPITIIVLIVIIIALIGPFLYKKFYKKNKVG